MELKKGPKKQYSREYKNEAVRLSQELGATAASKQLGLRYNMLLRWRKEMQTCGQEAFRGKGNRLETEKELQALRSRVRELELEQEILKKASAYFAKNLA